MTVTINAFYKDFINRCQNRDAIFVTVGIIFPFILFSFRVFLWYKDLYTFFDYGYSRFIEVILFCYCPAFIIFYFVSKKSNIFYSNIYKKICYIFRYFYTLGVLQVYFCKNIVYGFIVLTSSLFFYLYLLSIDSVFVHLIILLLIPYLSFSTYLCQDFLENHKRVVPNYCNLYDLRDKLKSEKFIRMNFAFSLFYLMCTLLLYRLDLFMRDYINLVESWCNTSLNDINEKTAQSSNQSDRNKFIELKKIKEEVFFSIKKKLIFYKASLYIYSIFQKPQFEEVWDQIQKFYDKIG